MSKQFLLDFIYITAFGVFTGYGVTHLVTQRNTSPGYNPVRETASINDEEHTLTKLAARQIYQDYFDIHIKHDFISNNDKNSSVVKAIIVAKKDLPEGLRYQWILGESVSVSSSHIDGTLGALKQGNQKEIPLIVYGFNKQAQTYLSFVLSGEVDNHKLHKEVLSSSRPEDSFEYVVQQAYAQEKVQEQQERAAGKVETKSIKPKKFDLNKIIK